MLPETPHGIVSAEPILAEGGDVAVPDGITEAYRGGDGDPQPRHPLQLVGPHVAGMLYPVAVILPWGALHRLLDGVEGDVDGPVPDGVDAGTIPRFMEFHHLLGELFLGHPVDAVVLRVIRIGLPEGRGQ